MRLRSIGLRLTLWYSAILAAALIVFGAGTWLAMRHSLYLAVNETLRDRVRGVERFIQTQGGSLSSEEMQDEFREHSVLGPGGDLFQVRDSHGKWLYRSSVLEDAGVRSRSTAELSTGGRYENLRISGVPLRMFSSSVNVRGELYTVQVAASLQEAQEALQYVFRILVSAIPVLLGLASLSGYWMSRRALAPVDAITQAARSIGAQNLSRRLPVPETGDELQRLSATLNAMFERLDAAFGRVTRFTADASHELRTPLTFMRTTAELALRKPRSEAEYRAALDAILPELERTSTLVEDLLLLARADSGAGGMRFAPMDVGQVLREACQQGKVMAEAKHILFEYDALETAMEVDGDAQALRRVFLILMDNAIKYEGPGGRIRIGMARSDGSVAVTVTDSGIGISAEDLPHIFDRFYRADKARSRETGGAGLGLAIARWIVEAHRGAIGVESKAGGGSTFWVRLPLPDGRGRI